MAALTSKPFFEEKAKEYGFEDAEINRMVNVQGWDCMRAFGSSSGYAPGLGGRENDGPLMEQVVIPVFGDRPKLTRC